MNRPLLRLGAPLTCASCGHRFEGHWIEGRETADQQCEACGHVTEATWPGFPREPRTVIVRAGDRDHHAA
jgi:hypothetical protein